MSIRLIAKELYAARQREEALGKEMAIADPAQKPHLAERLRVARAERRRLEAILAGHIDRGAPSS
ncbi:MAG: hypothetical protein QNJ22_22430 [Desulfosarcinaceae bacterium]|nr:hypothetical protein [Desulfosarcinaceae bacterium]